MGGYKIKSFGSKSIKKRVLIPIALIIIAALFFIGSALIKNHQKVKYTFNETKTSNMVTYPNSSFAVISDIHYYDNSLGTTGAAFEEVLSSDRKLLKNSAELLKLAVDEIIKSKVKFVLISGDLTKDGELVCHEQVSKELSRLKQGGIKVCVIPGNHDVNNPWSYKYEGDKSILVPNINAEQFADIYKDFGYGDAIYRDSNSLSYVAEPVDNLWVIALDTCRYKDNKPGHEEIVDGRITQEEEIWLSDMCRKANEKGKAVIVLEHHGVVEHWTGQSKLHPEYLVKDYKQVGELMASYGVRLAFTGHYHAQDITRGDFKNNGYLYDIETGSLSTAPCSIRYCTINDNQIDIKSDFIVGKLYPGTDFAEKSQKFVYDTVCKEAYKTLRKYFVPEKDANKIADYVGKSFIAHYSGDEDEKKKPAFNEKELGLWSRFVFSREKYVVDGLWKDLAPEDNNVKLDLR